MLMVCGPVSSGESYLSGVREGWTMVSRFLRDVVESIRGIIVRVWRPGWVGDSII